MRTVMTVAAAAALAGVAMGAAVQDASKDTKAASVLAAARKAIGGARLDDMKSFSLKGDVHRNVGNFQLDAELELLLEMPDKYCRSEQISGPVSGESTSGFNGDRPLRRAAGPGGAGGRRVFIMTAGGGTSPGEKLSPEEQEKADRAAVRAQRVDLSHLMLGWFATAHPSLHATYTYAGEAESADGGKAHVIEARSDDGFAARLFVDEGTSLPLMVTYKGPQPRTLSVSGARGASPRDAQKQIEDLRNQPPVMADYTLFFEEWQDVDGIKFPMKIRRAMAGTTTEEWAVGRIRINPKIDAKTFAIEN